MEFEFFIFGLIVVGWFFNGATKGDGMPLYP